MCWPGYFCRAAITQLIRQRMQKLYLHEWCNTLFIRLLMEVPELHFRLWSWVSLSFGTMRPSSLIVYCTVMSIGAMQRPGIDVALVSGMAKLYPNWTSFSMSFLSRMGLANSPLWFPKVSVSNTSFCLTSLLISTNGHSLPLLRIRFIRGWKGCRPKILLSLSGGLNSFPAPSSKSLFALSAHPRSKS